MTDKEKILDLCEDIGDHAETLHNVCLAERQLVKKKARNDRSANLDGISGILKIRDRISYLGILFLALQIVSTGFVGAAIYFSFSPFLITVVVGIVVSIVTVVETFDAHNKSMISSEDSEYTANYIGVGLQDDIDAKFVREDEIISIIHEKASQITWILEHDETVEKSSSSDQ